jgi:hypothetical protein
MLLVEGPQEDTHAFLLKVIGQLIKSKQCQWCNWSRQRALGERTHLKYALSDGLAVSTDAIKGLSQLYPKLTIYLDQQTGNQTRRGTWWDKGKAHGKKPLCGKFQNGKMWPFLDPGIADVFAAAG